MIELAVQDLAIDRGARRLFEGLSFALAAGEAATLVGANGAGKTSVLRAIAGLLRPAAGGIGFTGAGGPIAVENAREDGLHLIGHHDGLATARRAVDELVFWARWFGAGQLDAAIAAFGLDALLDLEVRRLSAGQRRRLALARLVAAPRPLWLLDEPLAPLDADHRMRFAALAQAHLAGGGMILAAVHDPLPLPTRAIEVSSRQRGTA